MDSTTYILNILDNISRLGILTTSSYNSYKINQKRFAHHFKATRKIIHIPAIHMFISQLNSKQKQLKVAQEFNLGSLVQHNSRGEVICSRWRAHIKSNSRGEKGYSPKANKTGQLRLCDHFSPKNPIFNFPTSNFNLKTCLIIIICVRTLKAI